MRWRRQHPIGPYVADFACVTCKLAIEVDGATHGDAAEVAHDARRTAYLERAGWFVMRVTNADVYERLDDVVGDIARAVRTLTLEAACAPAPSVGHSADTSPEGEETS